MGVGGGRGAAECGGGIENVAAQGSLRGRGVKEEPGEICKKEKWPIEIDTPWRLFIEIETREGSRGVR